MELIFPVCQNTCLNKVWSTFRKIRLRCDCSGLQLDAWGSNSFSAEFDGLSLMKRLKGSSDILVAVFRLTLEDGVHSVLCEFSSTKIREGLETKVFWSADESLDSVYDEFDCDQEFLGSLNPDEVDKYAHFLSQRTLLDVNVSGECKLVLPYDIKSFDSVEESGVPIIFLVMSSGKFR